MTGQDRGSEIYVSIDVETDGPAPGLNSMLALGAAAFADDETELGTWYATLFPWNGACQHPDTMAWWRTQPDAWAEVITGRRQPYDAIRDFTGWCAELADTGRLIAVAWPAAFDFAFVNYYCHAYMDHNPLGFSCCDIRSYANGLAGYPSYYGLPEKQVRDMAGKVSTAGLRPHVAVDDAIEQGRLFMALRRHALRAAENGP